MMVIRSACAVALYCQRCGKIHVRDIPYFFGMRQLAMRCDRCLHEQALLVQLHERTLELHIPCVACGTQNIVAYPMHRLRRLQLEKIYCRHDAFELGYIGQRRRIEEFLAFNRAEFEALHASEGKNFIEKQQILLEAMNRVHEIAAQGEIVCPCGSPEIMAHLQENIIVLECCHCGRYSILRAENATDLARLETGLDIDLIAPHCGKYL